MISKKVEKMGKECWFGGKNCNIKKFTQHFEVRQQKAAEFDAKMAKIEVEKQY